MSPLQHNLLFALVYWLAGRAVDAIHFYFTDKWPKPSQFGSLVDVLLVAWILAP